MLNKCESGAEALKALFLSQRPPEEARPGEAAGLVLCARSPPLCPWQPRAEDGSSPVCPVSAPAPSSLVSLSLPRLPGATHFPAGPSGSHPANNWAQLRTEHWTIPGRAGHLSTLFRGTSDLPKPRCFPTRYLTFSWTVKEKKTPGNAHTAKWTAESNI